MRRPVLRAFPWRGRLLRRGLARSGLAARDAEAALQQFLEYLLLRGRDDLREFLRPLRHQLLQSRDPRERLGGGMIADLTHQLQRGFEVRNRAVAAQSLFEL